MNEKGIRLTIVLIVIVGLFSIFSLPVILFDKQISFSPGGKLLKTFSLEKVEDTKTTFKEGQEVELTGILETLVIDDFENEKADYLYYLNVDGKRYELELEQSQPVVYRNDITIEGIFSKDKIIVDSLEPVASFRRGEINDSWPGILGEQRYMIGFLRFPDTPVAINDSESYTKELFENANQFIIENSYGKASLRGDFVGEFIAPLEMKNDIPDMWSFLLNELSKNESFNFSNYDGVVVYSYNQAGLPALASYFKFTYTFPGRPNARLYLVWMNERLTSDPNYLGRNFLLHEMGHNFGLNHASLLRCRDSENPKKLVPLSLNCVLSEYGDFFDSMGNSGSLQPYSLRNRFVLRWIDEFEIKNVTNGTFLLPALDFSNKNDELKGLRIPIERDNAFNEYSGGFLTHYFIDYRVEDLNQFFLIRLGRDSMHPPWNSYDWYPTRTWLIMNYPSIYPSNPVTYLREGQSYLDFFNNMTIKAIKTNASGGLIEIKKGLHIECGDINADGNVADLSDLTLLIDHLFINFPPLVSPYSANIDGVGRIDISDLTGLIDHMFINFSPLNCAPISGQTEDPTGGWTLEQVNDYLSNAQNSKKITLDKGGSF